MRKLNTKEMLIIAVIVFMVLTGWFFRYEVTPMNSDLGTVSYMNRWTGEVIVINQFGNSSQSIYLGANPTNEKAKHKKMKFIPAK